jgi:23S rRNA (uracil1939-C5)-methyltransferase
MKKDFLIDSIDPLGQGVSKVNENIIFIKKTLPGEVGITEIISNKKGVSFGTLSELKTKSPDRITPVCPHFNSCNGCDFLHTTHQKEVEFKLNNIKRSLGFLGCTDVVYHAAKNRINYRNRIQLHYNKKLNKLGFLDSKHQIVTVDSCVIGTKLITQRLKELYQESYWLKLVTNQKIEGHIELYEKNGKVEIAINQEYAHGGFTQVNQEMNEKLGLFLTQKIKELVQPNNTVFDLFGGDGNLTKALSNPTLVVDHYERPPANKFHQIFLHQDLYKDKAIANIKNFYPKNPDLIIFDPPRSGVKNLKEFVTAFTPQSFVLIACQFSSFTRDVKPLLENYHLSQVHIFDLFPSTHHFETIGIFTKRE